MKIVRTLIALAFLAILTSCAKEELSEMDALVNNDTELILVDAESFDIEYRRNIESPRIVEITTDVIRPQFTTQD